MKKPLANLVVLVTRPLDQAQITGQMIKNLGGSPILFPCITIDYFSEKQINQQLKQLVAAERIIVVSQYAAKQLENFGKIRNQLKYWNAKWFSVGEKTAEILRTLHLRVDTPPVDCETSEGLLTLDGLKNCDRRTVLIIKGAGGRDHLANQLTLRGAKVQQLTTYRRQIPHQDNLFKKRYEVVEKLLLAEKINAILATSVEVLHNLEVLLLPLKDKFVKIPLIVPSDRVQRVAKDMGFEHIISANSASFSATREALEKIILQKN